MLYLNKEVINRAVSMTEMMDGIDQSYALYERGTFHMPTRLQVQEDKNTLLLMPCFTGNYIATKLVTVFPGNAQIGNPTIHGLVALNCNKTGHVKALMDGAFITGMRTGAVGGSAIRHLARRDVTKLAVIGTGVQGYFQTIAACQARDFTEIYIYNRTPGEKVEKFIKKLQKTLGEEIHICAVNKAAEAIEHADVIITATTSSEPVLPNEHHLLMGKLIVGVGSFKPTMREFPKALYDIASHMYIDTHDAIEESGDIAIPLQEKWISKNNIQTLSSYIETGETIMNGGETVVFKSTGMALFDAVSAGVIYENAVKKQLGIRLENTDEVENVSE